MTATCKLHKAAEARCNISLTLGSMFTLEAATHRVKHWCYMGLQIPDGLGAREKHMAKKPRQFGESVLLPIDDLGSAVQPGVTSA